MEKKEAIVAEQAQLTLKEWTEIQSLNIFKANAVLDQALKTCQTKSEDLDTQLFEVLCNSIIMHLEHIACYDNSIYTLSSECQNISQEIQSKLLQNSIQQNDLVEKYHLLIEIAQQHVFDLDQKSNIRKKILHQL